MLGLTQRDYMHRIASACARRGANEELHMVGKL